MPFSFPNSPSVGQISSQNNRSYRWNGYTWDLLYNFPTHADRHSSIGSDPITIISNQISNFNSSVSGLLPITSLLAGNNVSISNSGSVYTISASGQSSVSNEDIDDRVSQLLIGGYGVNLNYNDNANSLTISTSGLQPSGSYANSTHNHTSLDITDFNSSVSGLLPVKNILAGTGIGISSSLGNYTITNSLSIIDYATSDSFPASGVAGYYYVDRNSGRLYQWNGSSYTAIGPSASSINNEQNTANLYLWSNFI